MFKFRSISQLTRRAGLVLVLAISLGAAMLPTVAMAAPLEGRYEGRGGSYGGPGCANYYEVRRGDTLSGIAAHFGTSDWALSNANGIGNPNQIYAGQYLCITGYGQQNGYPGGQQNGYPGNHQNGYPGGQQNGYPGNGHYANWYTVCAGDNLSTIAGRYGTSVWWLMKTNHLSNPNHIYAGQVLHVR
jgi:LysM repeat protein